MAIARRIQTPQREMPVLSASSLTARTEVDTEGTDAVFHELEIQVVALRRQFAGVSSRLHEDWKTAGAPRGYQELLLHVRCFVISSIL